MGGAGVSEANGVLRNHYHPPGATIYIEKRLTNQSYRLFSQPHLLELEAVFQSCRLIEHKVVWSSVRILEEVSHTLELDCDS